MIKEAAIATAGLGAVGGITTTVVVANSGDTNTDSPGVSSTTKEPIDYNYWEKEIRYKIKLKKDYSITSHELHCQREVGKYSFFRFRDTVGSNSFDLICDHIEERKDIQEIKEQYGNDTVSVTCTHTGDSENIKNFDCLVTGKDMQMKVKLGDFSKVTFYW
ncbi:hypothetical protein MHLP_01130 [Candidatus Mycoplasma haematolamae str. Purdue]|uniref:Uncharacterized protein n=1 Tax=Mycoplasma haematolamae (strain Purdue) TaxID=1212765 RepID=I7CEW7_MYCHA|nr:hypothetical protein [Candidatus Mycoplasma haematolamae]AFO51806.1 hypothetical protein MHLP_01130 [Candidatus Mycoplasma haematolamae str. Purdue]